MRTIPKTTAVLLMAALTGLILCIGIALGIHIGTNAHTDPRWTLPAPCKGCGYEVTTYYPNHKAETVNYFSGGGQQVTWSGVWVRHGIPENGN